MHVLILLHVLLAIRPAPDVLLSIVSADPRFTGANPPQVTPAYGVSVCTDASPGSASSSYGSTSDTCGSPGVFQGSYNVSIGILCTLVAAESAISASGITFQWV